MIIFWNKFTLMVVLDTVIEFLGLLPGFLYVRLLFWLDVLVFLVQKLLVILAFFDYLVQMIFLVFDRFLQFGTNNSLLSVSPFHKLFFECTNPLLLFKLTGQLLTDEFLLFYLGWELLSTREAMWSWSWGGAGSVMTRLLERTLSIRRVIFQYCNR